MKYLAKTLHGLEHILVRELEAIGAEAITPLKRAVEFEGDKKLLYRANLELRTAIRILQPIKTFRAQNDVQLYQKAYKFNWSNYLDNNRTFAIDAVAHSEYFNHSKYAALKLKDAIVDQFRKHTGIRPNVDTKLPHVRFNLHISGDRITISLDSSGESLHKRGYRVHVGEAPMNEVLAAGMIQLSGWQADCDFIDPMCGSGTLPIEAALFAHNIPSNWHRTAFGFERWPDFDQELWDDIRQAAKENFREFDYQIIGYDRDFKAIKTAQQNVFAAHLDGKIKLERKRFENLEAPENKPSLIMMNPPYDERLQEIDIVGLYSSIGDQLKQVFTGCQAWIISSNMGALKRIGLRPSKKQVLYNGALECKLMKYEMYEGTRKKTKEPS